MTRSVKRHHLVTFKISALLIHHIDLGENPAERRKNIVKMIRSGSITLAGYKKSKIYGRLSCSSGKKMKVENRIFFSDEAEALAHGYRPCGHCMPEEYKQWILKLPA